MMALEAHKKVWESLARYDPMWAILTAEEKRGRKWDREEFFRTGEREIASLLSDLAAFGLPAGRGAALDFGCGIGRLTQALAAHFDQVVGLDISEEMIGLARESNRYPSRCRYLVNNSADLSQMPDGSFDLVYSNVVLQHIAPRISKNYLREFMRVARPGGTIVFQVPCSMHWKRRIQWRRRLFVLMQTLGLNAMVLVQKLGLNPMRMAFIPQEEVRHLLRSCGAEVVGEKTWSDRSIASCRYIAVKSAGPPSRRQAPANAALQ